MLSLLLLLLFLFIIIICIININRGKTLFLGEHGKIRLAVAKIGCFPPARPPERKGRLCMAHGCLLIGAEFAGGQSAHVGDPASKKFAATVTAKKVKFRQPILACRRTHSAKEISKPSGANISTRPSAKVKGGRKPLKIPRERARDNMKRSKIHRHHQPNQLASN